MTICNQDEYLEMLRLEDKYTKPLSVWEVSKSFPDFRDIAIRVAYNLTEELEEYTPSIAREPLMAFFMKLDPRYIRLSEIKKYVKNTSYVVGRKELDIEKARQVPIQELYDFGKQRVSRNRIQTSCPFHAEKSPSFFIYTDQNSYHCFSCGCGGDVISFIMRLHNKKFVDAVNFINGD